MSPCEPQCLICKMGPMAASVSKVVVGLSKKMHVTRLAALLAHRKNEINVCYYCYHYFCTPSVWPRDDTRIVEKMKVLFEQGGVWDEFSDSFQKRVGNRSRVGFALYDYGIRPGHSRSPEPSSLPLLFETWEGDEKGRVPKRSSWGRHGHRHTENQRHVSWQGRPRQFIIILS